MEFGRSERHIYMYSIPMGIKNEKVMKRMRMAEFERI